MANRDLKTTVELISNTTAVITTDTDTDGSATDTASYLTVTFGFTCSLYDSGDYDFKLTESDDDATYTDVPASKLLGSYPTISAATVDGDVVPTVGVWSNKKYIKPVITSTNIGEGDGATIVISSIGGVTLSAS